MSCGFIYGKLDLPKCIGKGACTESQKPTETGTETVDTETACGIMALSQTTGHGIYFLSSNNDKATEGKSP